MIPYDDLVVALTAWRARQGLPVAQEMTAGAPPPPPARGRGAPPAPARAAASRAAGAHASVDTSELDAGALIEDASYDAGDDYVMQLGVEQAGEATAIGAAPEPVPLSPRGKRPGR